jgi:U3 small nucleolar ribonucleoprotein protein IMP3
MVAKLKTLKQDDEYRILKTEQLSNKLFEMGLTGKRQGLAICEKVTVTAFARRRLPIIMCKLKMAETTKDAVMYIE